jgi:predicted thioredoxin/glutaredoxin
MCGQPLKERLDQNTTSFVIREVYWYEQVTTISRITFDDTTESKRLKVERNVCRQLVGTESL